MNRKIIGIIIPIIIASFFIIASNTNTGIVVDVSFNESIQRPLDAPTDPRSVPYIEIGKIKVQAPIRRKDVIIENVLGTGVNIVASRSM